MQSNDSDRRTLGDLHYQVWGRGQPVIALHPLALESSAFAGLARQLGRRGMQTLGVDLPGFGRSPAPDAPLTASLLAKPVIELARSLDQRPYLVGMSLGGRVALEVALSAPDAIRGVAAVAPYLPWRSNRVLLQAASGIKPTWGDRLPLEKITPVLYHTARFLDSVPALQGDAMTRACVRVVYNSACPATRAAFLSASRELALDKAFGKHGLWTRLPGLDVPSVFLWAGKDRLIPSGHAAHVSRTLPRAGQIEVPCSGHFVNGAHFRCLERAMVRAVSRLVDGARDVSTGNPLERATCLVGRLALAQATSDAPA